jgi:hypothetical protein
LIDEFGTVHLLYEAMFYEKQDSQVGPVETASVG